MKRNRLAKIVLAVAGTAFLASMAVLLLVPSPRLKSHPLDLDAIGKNYDWERARSKLRAIGVALLAYREESGYLPSPRRRSFSDAGLPPSVSDLTARGRSWTLQEDNLFVGSYLPHPAPTAQVRLATDFLAVYRNPQADAAWKARGNRMPILVDANMYRGVHLWEGRAQWLPVLVLRLDGTVEKSVFRPSGQSEDMRTFLLTR